jgi:hypothetical protein
LTQLSIDSQHTNRELAKQLTEMRNEARWAKEALALAERKEVLAKQEIDSLRSASDVSALAADHEGYWLTYRVRACLVESSAIRVDE